MLLHQRAEPIPFADHYATEAKLAAQNLGQDVFRAMRDLAIDCRAARLGHQRSGLGKSGAPGR